MSKERVTKSEYVYNKLYEAITTSAIPPNTKLSVRDIANKFNVSEIPVREAMQRLDSEGILEYVQYAGYLVPAFSEHRLKCLWEIRLCLELLAVELAAENYTPKDIEALHKNIEEGIEISNSDNWEMFVDNNRAFHMTLYAISGNNILCKEINRYWNRTLKIRGEYSFKNRDVHRSVAEHQGIIAALEAHDVEKAKALIREHRIESWNAFAEAYHTVTRVTGQQFF